MYYLLYIRRQQPFKKYVIMRHFDKAAFWQMNLDFIFDINMRPVKIPLRHNPPLLKLILNQLLRL